MAGEIQIAKIVCTAGVIGFGIYCAKKSADNYLEIKAMSTMPESYFVTQQKEAEIELKKIEVQEAEETKRHQATLKHEAAEAEKNRAHQLEVMEKEKAYPESYWLYKSEEVKTKTMAQTVAKREQASVERQKNVVNALSTGFDIFTRRYL